MVSDAANASLDHVMPPDLCDFATQILNHFGFSEEASKAAAEMLVAADVHGLQSHGVSLALPRYLIILERGLISKGSDVRVVNETQSTALVDGQNNLGAVVAEKSVEILIDKARQVGSAWVSVNNSNHIGFLAHWCQKIIQHDMIGFVMTNGGPDMGIHGGLGKTMGTNPICIGAPGRPFPLILDMASSAVAMGKIRAAAMSNQEIPDNWGTDNAGQPTTNPSDVLGGGALLPMAGHKGSGLAVMVDVLCGLLSGANYSNDIIPVSRTTEPPNMGHLFGAICIDSFCPVDAFYGRSTEFIAALHCLPRLPGVDRIYLPGEKEFATAAKQRCEGVFVSEEAKLTIEELAAKYNCKAPEFVSN